MFSSAFAALPPACVGCENDSVVVSIPEGSGVPGCEETNECYIPATVTIGVGGTVTWSNDDTAAHTVTSGVSPNFGGSGPDGIFDSSLFMAGTTFSHTFDEAGEFIYFCMVHPWMQGVVIVQGASEPEPEPNDGILTVDTDKSVYSDGSIICSVTSMLEPEFPKTRIDSPGV